MEGRKHSWGSTGNLRNWRKSSARLGRKTRLQFRMGERFKAEIFNMTGFAKDFSDIEHGLWIPGTRFKLEMQGDWGYQQSSDRDIWETESLKIELHWIHRKICIWASPWHRWVKKMIIEEITEKIRCRRVEVAFCPEFQASISSMSKFRGSRLCWNI